MKFDFTPDPKVLIALTHTPMQPLDALCELIDNAIDSFYSARIQGVTIENPMIVITLPTRKQLSENSGLLRIQDNGPGMTAENAEKAIKAGFSGNNPYDTLGLFGMGFNISTGKLGNITTFMTSREDMPYYVKTVINLEKINQTKNYSLDAEELCKADDAPFKNDSHGTIIEVADWWPEGNANRGFVQKLVQYGIPKICEEIGRRYASILRKGEIKIYINGNKCEAFEHCVWDDTRYVTRKSGNIPAVMRFDQVVGSTKRCGSCTAILGAADTTCPSCGGVKIRTVEERVQGWIGIQRFDSDTDFGIDLIRNGRAIKISEKNAFFEYVDEFKYVTKDYPIDSQYGRIVGEINLDFVPVDFLKQDFQRSSLEWQRAMTFIRGNSSLQPSQPGASENNSPMFKLYQGYRRVRSFGRGDMYMGFWDADSRSAKRISRDTEKEFYKKFKQKLPGYYDDTEWWKLVELADQPPVEELPECPVCGAQNLKEAEECVACGAILKPKKCINDNCGKDIPVSATICPFCGASQIATILEPWTCKVCGGRNIATEEKCKNCGSPRGANHPLSKGELLRFSDKVDSLSNDGLKIKLADGSISNSVQVEVFSMQKAMVAPNSKETLPLIIHKEIGRLTVFVDLAHPFFTRCSLSKEQLIASEIAMYLYDERRNLSSFAEHNLSNITWNVLQTNWRDSVELSVDSVYKDANDLLNDLQNRIMELLGSESALYFADLTDIEKQKLTASLIQHGIDLSTIGFLKESGEYLQYTPYSFLLTLYHEIPDTFFGGGIWAVSLACGGEELLGADNVARARDKIINQYDNYLQDVIIFAENKYADTITLQRVKLSVEFLRKGMVQ
ncbi:ATP-binding protein [Mediterraneibacter gnavus]|uniref:ATP-binding protein n=1 Tax=Mediterraneibacter gnavus TaxID=33038 RepID=UPI00232E0975|nr:ATP-binding protein [Mediterraneibacter gnavus]MDB8711974.1 ATP-binding protein [Mediterraneibacter gnavus]MDB8715005.1 ATP-binding protein [Mediterraneibacter gnavus]